FPISHALAARLKAAEDVVRLDAGLAAEFMDETGKAKPEGSVVANLDLAQTLAALRVGGPNGFYGGAVGAKIIDYAQSQGGGIAVSDFAALSAARSTPQAMQLQDAFVYLPSQRLGAGAFA